MTQDPTFAAAYYRWSVCESFFGASPAVRAFADSALLHSSAANDVDRDLILSWHFQTQARPADPTRILKSRAARDSSDAEVLYQLAHLLWFYNGRHADAVRRYEAALRINPRLSMAYNDLAYCYDRLSDQERAIGAARRNVALRGDANALATLGDMFVTTDVDSAAKYFRAAVTLNPTFSVSVEKLASIALVRRQYEMALGLYQDEITHGDMVYRHFGRMGAARTAVFQGRFRESIALTQRAIEEAQVDRLPRAQTWAAYQLIAFAHTELAEYGRALEALNVADSLFAPNYHFAPGYIGLQKVRVLLAMDRVEEARRVASALPDSSNATPAVPWPRAMAWGLIAVAAGDAAEAVQQMERSQRLANSRQFELVYELARAKALQDPASAIPDLESVCIRFRAGLELAPTLAVLARYELGRAYEAAGRRADALNAYETFLAFWGATPHRIATVEDARRRVASLRAT